MAAIGPRQRALRSAAQTAASLSAGPAQPGTHLTQEASAAVTAASTGSSLWEGPWKARSTSTARRDPIPRVSALCTTLRSPLAADTVRPSTAAPQAAPATTRPAATWLPNSYPLGSLETLSACCLARPSLWRRVPCRLRPQQTSTPRSRTLGTTGTPASAKAALAAASPAAEEATTPVLVRFSLMPANSSFSTSRSHPVVDVAADPRAGSRPTATSWAPSPGSLHRLAKVSSKKGDGQSAPRHEAAGPPHLSPPPARPGRGACPSTC